MSHSALNEEQFHYHISSAENRESIRRFGLVGSTTHSPGEPRVYMTSEPAHYASFASEDEPPMDVWRVHTKGLTLHPDPHVGDAMHGAVIHRGDVLPSRLTHEGDAFEYALGHGAYDDE